jgi:hypothetical protein
VVGCIKVNHDAVESWLVPGCSRQAGRLL